MRKLEKCDVIPKWMFAHLINSGKVTLEQEQRRLQNELRNILDGIKKEVASGILNQKVVDCFYIKEDIFGDRPENWIGLYKKVSILLKDKYAVKSEPVKKKYEKELKSIMTKYQKWENKLLTGEVKRSEAKKFKL